MSGASTELRKRLTRIDDPLSQPDLTAVMESGATPIDCLNHYRLRHDVPCAFCSQHQAHRKGFTAQMPDERIALIGWDCAKHHFGDAFVLDMRSRIRHREILEDARERLGPVCEIVDNMRKITRDVLLTLESRVLGAGRAMRDALLGINLRSVVTAGGNIEIFEVAAMRSETETWYGRGFAVRTEERTLVGRVVGARFLVTHIERVAPAAARLERLAKQLEAGEIDKRKLTNADRELRTSVNQMREGLAIVRSAQQFFRRENIAELDRWFGSTPTEDRRATWEQTSDGNVVRVVSRLRGIDAKIKVPLLPTIPEDIEILGDLIR